MTVFISVCCGIVAIGVGGFLLSRARQRNAQQAQAIVVAVGSHYLDKRRSDGSYLNTNTRVYTPTLKYDTHKGALTSRSKFNSRHEYKVGDVVSIHYLRGNPKVFYLNKDFSVSYMWLVLAAFGVLPLLFLLLVLSSQR